MDFLQVEINAAANRHGLKPLDVAAIVSVESSFNPWAWNPEPRYRYLWDTKQKTPFRPLLPAEILSEYPPKDFHSMYGDPDNEWWGQSCSWGLMQVMGAVAREHGFQGAYLTQLCDPVINLEYGCKQLAALFRWSGGEEEPAFAAYNGGKVGNLHRPFRNQNYVVKVLAARSSLKP